MQRRVLAAIAAGALALSLTACADGDSGTTTAAESTDTEDTRGTTDSSGTSDTGVQFTDASVRAKAAADAPDGTDMTAIFGTLENNTGNDIELTGFSTSLGDASYEIHEVVDGVMQKKEGGITIPAGELHVLAPGSEHLMIMDYDPEIPAGDTITVTLTFADGSTAEADVAVRTMLSGDESYGEDGELQGHQHGMEHEGHGGQEH